MTMGLFDARSVSIELSDLNIVIYLEIGIYLHRLN
jgi:hypothetical protein